MSDLPEASEVVTKEEPKPACNAAAPVAVNGGVFAGCLLDVDHEGLHEFKVRWER